ncbi:metallophosphoesterase family protein [Fictibacillus barbaricus]|uniref:Phosphoesterase n=1 Tax=Fictibacillus barbaricus TaxID=182136 RepID=A0ABS2ZEB3_9BACL|nr:metallophosphoesterase [Fictibacillus barbaricus]MBN3545672.1 metallophosphoesterase [Fictibacillus barbaricus]GGB55240.1 phosphoesterase [Fictibacillus barbaricus]
MKKILIISDTHMPKKGTLIPEAIIAILKSGVDVILHAGDWTKEFVYEELLKYAPVHGVKGNVDTDIWSKELPEKVILQLEEVKIAIVHGHLGKGRSTPERAFRACEKDEVDLIVFGHSHIPFHEKKGNKVLFNPGSPTDKRRQKQFSFGVAIIDRSAVTLKHHYFS